ncbi:MAG: hypothetical protein KAQ93_04355 [Spirochaetales bacterium]|nr:hypothetical protein [Spirochaetales bacterium]
MNQRIGEYFVSLNILSFEQAEKILEIQKDHPNKKFGEIAVQLSYLDHNEVEDYLGKISK